MKTHVPPEFEDFSVVYCDESVVTSADEDEMLRRAIGLLDHGDRLHVLRKFIDLALQTYDEKMLQILWESTSPSWIFTGKNSYQRFFTRANELITEHLNLKP